MAKNLLFPVIFAIVAYFTTPMLGPEANGATRFFLVAVGIGLGVMLNILLFGNKKNDKNKSS